MKRASKAYNVRGETNFKQKQRLNFAFTGNTLTESSPVQAQKISLLIKLHAINTQLYQN